MERQSATQPTNAERKIMAIVRRLPPARSEQVLAFARFMVYEAFNANEVDFIDEDIFEDVDTEHDARWEAIFASDEGQDVLDKLADEALAEIRAGNATPMVFTPDGEIAPE